MSKGRKPDHCKYYTVEVEWEVLDKILGFMPFTSDPDLLCHYRDEKGKIIFLPAHFRAYLGQNLRIDDKSASLKNYFRTDYGYVELNGKKIEVEEMFIVAGHGGQRMGRGMRKYEIVPAGALIRTRFGVPGTDFKPKEFEEFLSKVGEFPIRGFGGRSSVYGRLKLNNFKVV